VHVELTGEDVTECIGGARGLSETDLERAYKSRVDPRLNYEQALEMAMLIARHVRGKAMGEARTIGTGTTGETATIGKART
jgi:3-deoxy-7-phosphoheptulonate synthase